MVETLELARERREHLAAGDMAFHSRMLEELSLQDREMLINQSSLGLGSATAPVIFVGSEHAYNLRDSLPYSLEAVGLTILWLCGGRADVTSRLSGNPWPHSVPFHVHPNALYRVHETKRGEHTWKVLASILTMAMGIADRNELLGGYEPGLGDLAYQVELSAYPARRSYLGREPSRQRVEFLEELMQALQPTARVLVFHGRSRQEPWQSIQKRLARAFLGLTAGQEMIENVVEVDGVEIRWATENSRKVLFARALNGIVSAGYRKCIAEQIKGVL